MKSIMLVGIREEDYRQSRRVIINVPLYLRNS